ncbi:hypothetical protein CK203_098274 [Vitis vinifera]|uniref:Uncharacterized protein n=1 Tax=Vitis vinifera TaxID=29760 RepID=A0A438E4G9_VITVI|nr:hypothetical protein CK203_098274 [Vitis vinifera]
MQVLSLSGFRNLLAYIPLWTRLAPSVSMRCDSQCTIAKNKSKIFNGKNEHIRLRHNIVQELLEIRVISLEFVRLELNLANPLTKPLNKKLVEETSRWMRLMPITEVKGGEHTLWIHLYESGGGVASYENLGRFFGVLMNIQVRRMAYLCQPVMYSS